MNTDSQCIKQEACFAQCDSGVVCCRSTTPVSLLANDSDVRCVLQGQVSLAAVNQMYVFHEALNGCKKSKDSWHWISVSSFGSGR